MSESAITRANNHLLVTGDLDFNTVPNIWQESRALLAASAELSFDFSNVSKCNSAALALMLEWVKYAKLHHKKISFNQIPQQLLSIAKACGVEEMLLRK